MQLNTRGVLIRWCSLLGAPGATSVLHPVRLHRETINHQNSSKTEEREGRKIGAKKEKKNVSKKKESWSTGTEEDVRGRKAHKGKEIDRPCPCSETTKDFQYMNVVDYKQLCEVRVQHGSQGDVRPHNNQCLTFSVVPLSLEPSPLC